MNNLEIFRSLEEQRDSLFVKLNATSISDLYKEQYDEIKAGRLFVFDNNERQMLRDIKALSKDNSLNNSFNNKLQEYLSLDNKSLTLHFQGEIQRMSEQLLRSGKLEEIQAIFIEYDHYYHYISSIICYGKQEYPLIDEPRYITGEYDRNKKVLKLDDGINFQPAWIDCEEFGDLEYLEINFDLENLFRLHSRTLLHKAFDNLNRSGALDFLNNRPFSIYINEHDSEVMMLYRLNK